VVRTEGEKEAPIRYCDYCVKRAGLANYCNGMGGIGQDLRHRRRFLVLTKGDRIPKLDAVGSNPISRSILSTA
jgi:hypothetical protein